MYIKYNDNELIYLIKEGSDKALELMFDKYEHLITTIVKEAYPYGDKANDLIQEGRMVLFECIRFFNCSYNISFYTYFYISLKRKLSREFNNDYYKGYIPFRESKYGEESYINNGILTIYDRLYKDDDLAMLLLNDYFLGNISLSSIAKKYGIDYMILFRKKNSIIRSMKKYID